MRGILSYGAYVPWNRLDRAAIGAALGASAGRGTRSVASYDEDTNTMGVAAARVALGAAGVEASTAVDNVWFTTTAPAYADKTNATTVHAALRLGRACGAFDAVGSIRSAAGAWRAALGGSGTTLVVAGDARTGLPGSADERDGGDGASALLIGSGDTVVAEYLGGASLSEEFTDRWRVPGELRSRTWEERFGETRYVPLAEEAWKLALDDAGVSADQVSTVVVTGSHTRAVKRAAGKIGTDTGGVAGDLADSVGNTGAAHLGLVLADVLDRAEPGQVIVAVSLADGADVFVFRTTDALSALRRTTTVADQVAAAHELSYLKFLSWNRMVTVAPPNRPEPARASAAAAVRNDDWKFGFVGSTDRSSGALHLPPARVSFAGGTVDDMEATPMADVVGTVVTFTVDRLAYSPSPPIVFAVVDFDGGGRLPIELTDVEAAGVAIGDRVEMTFRRINAADGIQNYFWKARPVRGAN